MDDGGFGFLYDRVVFSYRPLQAIWLAWIVLAVRLIPRDRWVVGVTGLGLGLRWALTRSASPLPDGKGWWLMNTATGNNSPAEWPHDVYGDAWESIGSLVALVGGGDPDAGVWVALGVSTLAIPWVVEVGHRASGSPWVGRLAGVIFALMPLPVALGQTVSRFVLAPMLLMAGLAAWYALDDDRPRPAWVALGALSAGLLAHTRPLLAIVAALLVVAIGWRVGRRPGSRWAWPLVAVGVGLVGLRLLSAVLLTWAAGETPGAKIDLALVWWNSPIWWYQGVVALNPFVTPAIVPALALYGVVRGSKVRGRGVLVATALASAVPWLHFHYAFDLARMQMASYPMLALFAALGVQALVDRWGKPRWIGVALVPLTVGSWWMARHPRHSPLVSDARPDAPRSEPRARAIWSWVPEEDLVRAGLPGCDRALPVVIGPLRALDPFAEWLSVRGWTPHNREGPDVPAGSCRFVGVDVWREGEPVLDGWSPRQTQEIVMSSDDWYPNDGKIVTIGWYTRDGRDR